ncbi:MAG TPA: polynucleotide adenylyltransferase [Firmicutes bacterium]|nr:polynucleotide adenylyltransferase [Bacillota bacterium]HBG42917.1 polynucleotide adenylyltransferase [Bacillota bacterium]HBR23822.1 polynucleotide adenylyltransferase [Bacillota bacterium]HCF91891.1 polynucleotide adenylyltransferase [Bacillota bacterium]HCM17299.1 polynucleotide adenylyltransferase [Bacillota bacterium]
MRMLAIPNAVVDICRKLHTAGFHSYVVGGAVRDSLLNRPVHDWDIATNAAPEDCIAIFPKVIPTGMKYGTVTIVSESCHVEVTTYRCDGVYRDGRRPESVGFVADIQTDLARRDFTINAMAYDPLDNCLIDPFGGQQDLRDRLIRTVGGASRRFAEDALRMLRAVRFMAELGFTLDPGIVQELQPEMLGRISMERIREEFSKIVLSDGLADAIRLLRERGLLAVFLPALAATDIPQNRYHKLTVFEHCLKAAELIRPDLTLRLAALLHDTGKPHTRSISPDGQVHFYRHEAAGAELAQAALLNLKYPKNLARRVALLITQHMSDLNDQTSDKSLRRTIQRVGADNIFLLLDLRIADRAAGKALQKPFDEVGFRKRIANMVQQAPLSLDRLAVNGDQIMKALGLPRGPLVGEILEQLLDRVLADPELNTEKALLAMARTIAERGAMEHGASDCGAQD